MLKYVLNRWTSLRCNLDYAGLDLGEVCSCGSVRDPRDLANCNLAVAFEFLPQALLLAHVSVYQLFAIP